MSVRTTQLSSLTGKIVASRARVNISQGPARERLEQKIRKLEEEKRATLGGLHLEDHDNVSLKLHSMGMDLTAAGWVCLAEDKSSLHAGVSRGMDPTPKENFEVLQIRPRSSPDLGISRPSVQTDLHLWQPRPTKQTTLRTPLPAQGGRPLYGMPGSSAHTHAALMWIQSSDHCHTLATVWGCC